MFRRSSSAKQPIDAPVDEVPAQAGKTEAPSGKGRPTPSRRDAESARKQRLGALPSDPKQAKRAERDAQRASYDRSRQALKAGDERFYPARDQGKARAFVRDYVDGRFRLLELLMPLVVLSWATLITGKSGVIVVGELVMEVVVVVGLLLGVLLTFRVKRAVAAEFGPEDVRGTGFYAFSRALMPRFMRQPKARVTMSGKPKV
ncbi:DUF3043 domain-containing protein [Actinospica durhamensis]|uniref:DUF3043 domain-containing protein n=1 Tax=Actinospica durhamensis TaxID=1508375 RepID=A0A941EIJ0_9ACTN|nr:DUF3043 domain-containing protein [Actinospica durhamensis]MBR7832142.1 DUF3043 domain-containing protein [Actinospica durhamensis]